MRCALKTGTPPPMLIPKGRQERVDEYEENDNALLIKIFRNKPEKNKTEQRGAYYQGDFNLDDAEDRDEKCGHNGQGAFTKGNVCEVFSVVDNYISSVFSTGDS